jgi:hypothetical protein
MDAGTVYTLLAIVAGMLLEITVLLRHLDSKDIKWLAVTFITTGALGFVPLKHESAYSPARHAMIACGLFVWFVAWILRDRVLPRIQEGTVLIWTCIFVYAVASAFGPAHPITIAAMAIALVMAIVLVLPMSFAGKLIAYAWFLVMVTAIAALEFRFADFGFIVGGRVGELGYSTAVLDGMAFAYLGVHSIYLLMLIPIPLALGREAFRRRMRQWRSDTAAMAARFSDRRVDPVLALAVMTSLGAVLYWNLLTRAVAPWLLINLSLVSTPVLGDALVALVHRHRNLRARRMAHKS